MRKNIILIIAFIILTPLFIGCSKNEVIIEPSELDKLSELVSGEARITSYTTYGRFFNLEGDVDGNIPDLTLVFKNKDEESYYDLVLNEGSGVTNFKTTNLINEGINLEKIPIGSYTILLKSGSGDNIKYYTLVNESEMEDINYYTVTKDNENKEINILFNKYKDMNYLSLDTKNVKLPNDIYDIVIDPGHGGRDVGANKNGHYESQINLDYALKLKEELEKLGLKVKLTRESDESIPNYGDGSRVSTAYIAKAKLLLSIHQNSAVYNVGAGGVEVYVPNHANTSFASKVAQNIVDATSTGFSKNVSNRVASGVYMRTLKQSDLDVIKKEADKKGYTPYEKATTDSTYYFIIRETGGVVTGAYVDSRNPEDDWNPYYNSNQGVESYLLELGYINSSTNLNILLTEKDKYIEAIKMSVKEYLEI